VIGIAIRALRRAVSRVVVVAARAKTLE